MNIKVVSFECEKPNGRVRRDPFIEGVCVCIRVRINVYGYAYLLYVYIKYLLVALPRAQKGVPLAQAF